jgi:hypothetical protein
MLFLADDQWVSVDLKQKKRFALHKKHLGVID